MYYNIFLLKILLYSPTYMHITKISKLPHWLILIFKRTHKQAVVSLLNAKCFKHQSAQFSSQSATSTAS